MFWVHSANIWAHRVSISWYRMAREDGTKKAGFWRSKPASRSLSAKRLARHVGGRDDGGFFLEDVVHFLDSADTAHQRGD